MTVPGIDIASYQPTDYGTAGLGFVMVKATEGTGYVNPRHAAQVAHARAHGLVVGHYHFARPGDFPYQVAYFLQHAAPAAGDVLCLDWEDSGVSSAWKDLWIRQVQRTVPGHRVILYCNRDFWLHHDKTSFAGDGLWIADPDAPAGHPRVQHPWVMHQYGSPHGLDVDVANFPDVSALRAWAAGTTPHTQEDDMTLSDDDIRRVALAVQGYRNADADAASVAAGHGHIPDVYGYQVGTNRAVVALTAQVGALSAAVAALARDGALPLAQVQAAAEAGADAALAKLGHALDGTTP